MEERFKSKLGSKVGYRVAALASAGLLILALGDWPYGYYTFLPIAVCLTAFYGSVQAFSHNSTRWGVPLAGVAVLFNPVIPIHLSESAWAPLDVVSAGIVGGSAFVLGSKKVDEEVT